MRFLPRIKRPRNIKKLGETILQWFEISLGVLVLVTVLMVTIRQVIDFGYYDWSDIGTFIEALKIILQLAIGIEVARLLFSYNLNTIIELAVFIVARKMLLLIDGGFLEILLGVLALAILFAVRHFFVRPEDQ
jgi:hypothetical protein